MCICLFSLVSYFLCMYKMLYTPDIMHFVSWNTFASMFYGKRMREHSSSLSYLAFINAFTNIYNMPGTLLWTVVSTVVDADAVSVPQFNLQSRDSYRLRNWLLYYNFKTRCQRVMATPNAGYQQGLLEKQLARYELKDEWNVNWTKLGSACLGAVKPIHWHQAVVRQRAAFTGDAKQGVQVASA